MNDADYMAAFNMVVMPLAYKFQPELVLISAGFDAAAGDPLGQMRVTPRGYAHMTSSLKMIAGGKLVLVLEGGCVCVAFAFAFARLHCACTALALRLRCACTALAVCCSVCARARALSCPSFRSLLDTVVLSAAP